MRFLSHTDRYRNTRLAENVQRRSCDKARPKHEHFAVQTKEFNFSKTLFSVADGNGHGSLLLRAHIDNLALSGPLLKSKNTNFRREEDRDSTALGCCDARDIEDLSWVGSFSMVSESHMELKVLWE